MTSEHHLLESEVRSLQEDWTKKVAADAKYWLENDAKKRAISSAKSYEEFRFDILVNLQLIVAI